MLRWRQFEVMIIQLIILRSSANRQNDTSALICLDKSLTANKNNLTLRTLPYGILV